MSVAPPPTAAPDADRLLAELAAVGVLPAEETGRLAGRFADPSTLADHLLQDGRLTPFQAERAVLGGGASLVVGPYRLEEPLGNGTAGTTYRATHRHSGGAFAVRVLPMRSAWRVMHARKQLAAFAALPPHPAVVPFADVDSANGLHYLAWPWADGTTLDRHILQHGPFQPNEAARIFAELADGLRACHAAGLVHGLIRPRSLLLGGDRQPRLLDLGLGGMLADNVGDDRSLFDTLALANGSAAMADFAAPEVLLEPAAVSFAADSYSLGCCLYFALTGRVPFPDDKLAAKVVAHLTREPVPVSTLATAVPPALAAVVERFMRKEADERPTDFAELRDELRAVAAGGSDTGAGSNADTPSDAGEWSGPSGSSVKSALIFEPTGEVTVPFDGRAARRDDAGQIDFDAVPSFGTPRPADEDSGLLPPPLPPPPARRTLPSTDRLTPLPTPDQPASVPRPLPPPKLGGSGVQRNSGGLLAPPQRILPAAAGTKPRRPPVVLPPPPMFDLAPIKAARSVMFWKKSADTVQLTVFGPAEVPAGGRAKVLVYVHLPEAFGGVATLCRALNPDAELLGGGYVQRPVPRTDTLGLHLSTPAGAVAKPLVELTWTGQTQPKAFELLIPWECSPGLAEATLAAGWRDQRVAEVPLHLVITPRTG